MAGTRPCAASDGRRSGESPAETHIGEDRRRAIRTFGGNEKIRALRATYANVANRATGSAQKVKIETVERNTANPNYVRRNLLTKGAIIRTEPRPGPDRQPPGSGRRDQRGPARVIRYPFFSADLPFSSDEVDPMSLQITVAAPFRHLHKEQLQRSEFVYYLAIDRMWMNRDQAGVLLDLAVEQGLVEVRGGLVVPLFPVGEVAVPLGYRPGPEDLERPDPERLLLARIAGATGRERARGRGRGEPSGRPGLRRAAPVEGRARPARPPIRGAVRGPARSAPGRAVLRIKGGYSAAGAARRSSSALSPYWADLGVDLDEVLGDLATADRFSHPLAVVGPG